MTTTNRRGFLKTASLISAGAAIAPNVAFGKSKKEKSKKVNIAFIGLGGRGIGHLIRVAKTEDVEITAICDIDPATISRAQKYLVKNGHAEAEAYTDGEYAFEKMLEREDIDGVIISTPWLWHAKMAVKVMKAGKYAAVEVAAANTIEECWDMVNASEETGMPCMILENVNYGRQVLAVSNMVKQGVFGNPVHATCGYRHSLLGVKFNKDMKYGEGAKGEAVWRTEHSLKRNADVYPTHGVGPIAAMLDINRGNRFLYLTATASKAAGLKDYIEEHPNGGKDHPYAQLPWKQGDVITSVIKTANGETIIVKHDCNLPRPYSLDFSMQGTDGLVEWDGLNRGLIKTADGSDINPARIHVEGQTASHGWEELESWIKKYDHPLWKKYEEEANKSSHNGIDFFVTREFINCVKEKRQPVMDVYDAAAWSAITPLSEASIAAGSAPQYFPDFTRGNWIKRKPIDFK